MSHTKGGCKISCCMNVICDNHLSHPFPQELGHVGGRLPRWTSDHHKQWAITNGTKEEYGQYHVHNESLNLY